VFVAICCYGILYSSASSHKTNGLRLVHGGHHIGLILILIRQEICIVHNIRSRRIIDHAFRNGEYPVNKALRIDRIIDEVTTAVSRWPQLAKEYEVPLELARTIEENLRLKL